MRAAIFLGLGVNAARDKSFVHYQLPEISHLRLVPENATETQLADFKDNFEKWIISNGLRELVESYAVFLDEIFQASLWFATSKELIKAEEANKLLKSFKKIGVEGKLKSLRTHFNISTAKEKYFSSINQARNCITHRRGKVGQEDLRDKEKFELVWWAFELIARSTDGQEISLTPPLPKEGILIESGGSIYLKVIDKIKEYNLGDFLKFSPSELNEICLLFQLATDDIIKSTVTYSKSIGIQIAEQTNPADPAQAPGS